MDRLTIEAKFRTDMSKGRMKQVRREGFVTASVFGHDDEPVSLEVNLKDIADQIKASEAGMMALIDLKVTGAPKKADGIVMIKSFYKDPLTRKVLDLQLQRVSLKEKMHVKVPVEIIGEAAGAKEGGILEQVTTELEVKCLPNNIPSKFEVDVTNLGIGQHIRVSDIAVSSDVEMLSDPETLIANCSASHAAKSAEDTAEAAAEEA